MSTKIVILAAGKGTRMKSALPKVLHKLANKSLLQHVLDNVSSLQPDAIYTVVGHGSERVREAISDDVIFVEQLEQKGTGHAVQQVLSHIDDDDDLIIAYGDVPLTRSTTFSALSEISNDKSIGLLTFKLEDPTGYGRIVRDQSGRVTGIVEQKDANEEQLKICELNTGMLSIRGGILKTLLAKIDNNNAQGEYYLTDIFSLAAEAGIAIETTNPADDWEVAGVNSRTQLAELERIFQRNQACRLMDDGVTVADPNRIDIRGNLTAGRDVEIDINCVFIGEVTLGDGVVIGPNCVLENCTVAAGSKLQANCVVQNASVGEFSTIGPFARLRPGAMLENETHIGNFVEIKNAKINTGSKVNHLSYIGDADIGKNTNIGAGTITCNYDGAFKHLTKMGDNVFIGSNSALVAPVEIASGATVGAGSIITKKVDVDELALTRSPQKSVRGWKRPQKPKKTQD